MPVRPMNRTLPLPYPARRGHTNRRLSVLDPARRAESSSNLVVSGPGSGIHDGLLQKNGVEILQAATLDARIPIAHSVPSPPSLPKTFEWMMSQCTGTSGTRALPVTCRRPAPQPSHSVVRSPHGVPRIAIFSPPHRQPHRPQRASSLGPPPSP